MGNICGRVETYDWSSKEGVLILTEKLENEYKQQRCDTAQGTVILNPNTWKPPTGVESDDVQCKKEMNWTRGKFIGGGAFGKVHLALNNDSGELMAVKQVAVAQGEGGQSAAGQVHEHIRQLEEEINFLQSLHHDNIVQYLGIERLRDVINIFMEYIPGGSITSLMDKFGPLPESVIRVYTRQILEGLEYLHENKIIHRDIKGANVLVDTTGRVKLADFGASKKIETVATGEIGDEKGMSVKGTPYWMAPEVIRGSGTGTEADIWSLGCTVLEMHTGENPWGLEFNSAFTAMYHIAQARSPPPIPHNLSPHAREFLLECFRLDPKLRPKCRDLLKHPFVSPLHKPTNPRSSLPPIFVPPFNGRLPSPIVEEVSSLAPSSLASSQQCSERNQDTLKPCLISVAEIPDQTNAFNPVNSYMTQEFSPIQINHPQLTTQFNPMSSFQEEASQQQTTSSIQKDCKEDSKNSITGTSENLDLSMFDVDVPDMSADTLQLKGLITQAFGELNDENQQANCQQDVKLLRGSLECQQKKLDDCYDIRASI